jgi:tRNA(fMet)-specific endonuclease VapC
MLEQAGEILIPVTVLGELHAGFQLGARAKEGLGELNKFLAQPGVRVLDVTDAVAERYGVIIKLLKKQGTPIPTNDVWIAATIMETGARLAAYDARFSLIPGLLVETP